MIFPGGKKERLVKIEKRRLYGKGVGKNLKNCRGGGWRKRKEGAKSNDIAGRNVTESN